MKPERLFDAAGGARPRHPHVLDPAEPDGSAGGAGGRGPRKASGLARISELDAQTIFANAPDPVFVSDLQGKILQANDAVSKLLGLRQDEVLEQSVSRFLAPEEVQEFMGALYEVVERGVTRNVLLHPRSATGEVIPTSLNASALRDSDGHVIGASGILRDMRELDKARAYAESLIKNAPDPVFVSDLQGKILQANNAVYELLGFRTDEVIEQSLSRFLNADETAEFMAALREVVERGATRNARLTPRSASGEVIPTILNASALRAADGQVIGAIGILHDMRAYERVVRDLEESRRALGEANRAKDQFLAVLSHELRTPLHAILGWIRLVRDGVLPEGGTTKALEVVERNAKVQAQLIEDLLDISRIIAGKLRLEVRPVDPARVIEASIDAVESLAEAKDIRLEAMLDPSTGPVSADPNRLQQVVWNLLSNAIKFTPRGGRVTVTLASTNGCVRIIVSDTGQGVEPEFLPYIFDHFHQAESPTARKHGGLGLGLAIVRHIVALHGGTAKAESPGPGQGTTITVELPRLGQAPEALGAERSTAVGAAAAALRDDTLREVHVLLVEDEADARELLVTVLGRCGAKVTAVGSTREALQQLEAGRPDVLVSDIGLPGEDGYVLMRTIRSMKAERAASIPAVALTAYAGIEDRQRALQAGYHLHVPKPVEPAELVVLVANLARLTGKL
jgi:PAS domain S-box-containing protein